MRAKQLLLTTLIATAMNVNASMLIPAEDNVKYADKRMRLTATLNVPEKQESANDDVQADSQKAASTGSEKQESANDDVRADSQKAASTGSDKKELVSSRKRSSTESKAQLSQDKTTWKAFQSDSTLREVMVRWAEEANWRFENSHWTVDFDIPITASAIFKGDFITATQQLVETTELSASPLQPCFYSNKVVRVVPFNEACDRFFAR